MGTMSKVKEYLKRHKMTQLEFFAKSGVSQATISRACNGFRLDPDNALKIERATDYEITIRELLYPKPES